MFPFRTRRLTEEEEGKGEKKPLGELINAQVPLTILSSRLFHGGGRGNLTEEEESEVEEEPLGEDFGDEADQVPLDDWLARQLQHVRLSCPHVLVMSGRDTRITRYPH